MRHRTAIAAGLALTLTSAIALAQDPTISRRQTGSLDPLIDPSLGAPTRVAAPGAGRAAFEELDPDAYGEQAVLLRIDEWQPWSFGATAGYEYQTNAALTPFGEVDDTVFRLSGSGRGTFPLAAISDRLYLSAGAVAQLLRYDTLDLLDYDRVDIDAGLLWVLPDKLPVLGGSVLSVNGGYYRLSEAGDFGEELFANYGPGAGLLRSIPLGTNHSLLISATADVSLWASDEAPRRHEYTALAGVTSRWAPRLESSTYAGMTLYDYDTHDDWNFNAGASVDFLVRENVRVGVSTTFSHNDSDRDVFDYTNFGVGGNLRVSIQF